MSRETRFDRDDFVKLILSKIEHNSSNPEKAKEYLSAEGYDVQEVINEGLERIKKITSKLGIEDTPQNTKAENTIYKIPNNKIVRKNWRHQSVVKLIEESGNDDPFDEIKTRARNLVLHAFEKGWSGPPYSPIQLAELLGMNVLPNDSVIDARIIPQPKNSFQIQYNPFQKPTRINFSVAHEIAHTLFSDCADSIRNREEEPQDNRQLEQLCNAAASEIQLPYAIFSNDANIMLPSIKNLINLATKYKASLESVFIRYTEVIDQPCAILIGIFQDESTIIIDYYKKSRYFELDMPDRILIPKDSKVYECTSPGWTSEETTKWDAFGGKSIRVSSVGISPYRRDTKPRVGILILPEENLPYTQETGKIILEYGDATKPRGKGKKVIAQVVNTSGGLGFGFGASLAKNYPIVKTSLKEWSTDKSNFKLGNTRIVQVSDDTFVCQMLAQKGLFAKGDEIPLRYKELKECLTSLRKVSLEGGYSIHMPAIGAGQAGGDWDIIIGMIHDELVNFGLKVNIYLLPGKPFKERKKSNLTLFKENSTWEIEK